MRTIQFEGKDCKGRVETFTQNRPNEWMVLTAPDGTEIRVKVEITELIRVVDEYYANGEPAYLVSWSMTQTVNGAEGSQKSDKKKVVQ